MDEHTLKRSIVLAVVWLVVLGVNATAAHVVTADSLDQHQSGLIVIEDGRNSVEDPYSNAGDTDRAASGERRTDAGAAGPAALERAGDERRPPGDGAPAGHGSSAASDPPTESDSSSDRTGDERSSERHHSAESDSDPSLVESVTTALGLGSPDASRSDKPAGRSGESDGRAGSSNNDGRSGDTTGPTDRAGDPPREANGRENAENPRAGPPGRQQNTCTSGELLAKYEVGGNGFVFEKGTDVVTITDIVRAEGEPKGFAFESSALVSTASVKVGPEIRTVELHGRHGTVALTAEKHAISNVVFCQNPFYQVDFVTGPPVENFAEGFYGDRKIQFASGVVGKDDPQSRSDGDRPACLADTENIEIIENGTAATVTFDVQERCELSLVSYETRSLRFDRESAHQQRLVDSVSRTFDPGRYEITVSLPDAGDEGRKA